MRDRAYGENPPAPTHRRPAPRMVTTQTKHWSACPECGADRLDEDQSKWPETTCKGKRLSDEPQSAFLCYMRCRVCDCTYKALRPD
jgi:hypothetical protein